MNKTATKKTNMSRMKATAMMKAIMDDGDKFVPLTVILAKVVMIWL